MSLSEWNSRVLEAEAELRCVVEERAEIERRRDAKTAAIRKHKDTVKKEKAALTKRLQTLEQDALGLAARTEAATAARDAAEASYHGAMSAYEALHEIVKSLKQSEDQIKGRPDLEKEMEKESIAWAEEEHSLRTALHEKEAKLKAQRRHYKEKVVGVLEGKVKALEERLAKDRACRRSEGWVGPSQEEEEADEKEKEEGEGEDGRNKKKEERAEGVDTTSNRGAGMTDFTKGAARKRPSSPLRERTNITF